MKFQTLTRIIIILSFLIYVCNCAMEGSEVTRQRRRLPGKEPETHDKEPEKQHKESKIQGLLYQQKDGKFTENADGKGKEFNSCDEAAKAACAGMTSYSSQHDSLTETFVPGSCKEHHPGKKEESPQIYEFDYTKEFDKKPQLNEDKKL